MTDKSNFRVADVFNVKDKVTLVTGGGSGIGLMIVQTLAINGAKVYIVGRTEEKLEKVAELYGKDIPGQIIPIVGDVADKEGVK
jgi:NADP-dependent 3-hydroxy acid dehydrogenase YdfG